MQIDALPAQAQSVISGTLASAHSRYGVRRVATGWRLVGGGVAATVGVTGAVVHSPAGAVSFATTRIGRGALHAPPTRARPLARGNRVTLAHSGLSESYEAGPLGIEQAFTVSARPPGNGGALTLSLTTGGSLRPRLAGAELRLVAPSGGIAIRYGGLVAVDAGGRRLPASLALAGRTLLLHVSDRGARYPIRIDPFIQQGQRLTGSGEIGEGQFGSGVALSADGNTTLVGAPANNYPNDPTGAVWVFTRSGGVWSERQKLTGAGGTGQSFFGRSVALSADGNTALIGGDLDNGNNGAAWVFTRSGDTFSQQGPKLTGSGSFFTGFFGASVALSADGNTALIGGYGADDVGAAWVFTRAAGAWTEQKKLLATGATGSGRFGISVALSASGTTAVIGGDGDNGFIGAAWVFTHTSGDWVQQQKLTAAGEVGKGQFGRSVSLSEDGNTALIGSPQDSRDNYPDRPVGAAWIFNRAGTTWSQTLKLTATPGTGLGAAGITEVGYSVAMSADAGTALIGGHQSHYPIVGWAFVRSADSWKRLGPMITGSGEVTAGVFDISVALSLQGDTALIGSAGDNHDVGATWAFVNHPAISGLSPSTGPAAGGTRVTIHGTGLGSTSAVKFGAKLAPFNVDSSTQITATSPPGSAGTVHVRVTNAVGTSTATSADRFTYTLPQLTKLSVSPRKFVLTGRLVNGRCVKATRANRNKRSCKRPIKLRISYQLDSAAQVTIKVRRKAPGRRVNGRCVKPTHRNRTRPRCTRWIPLTGKLTRTGKKGANTFTFTGRIGGNQLKPGSYRLVATPGAGGHHGNPRITTFQIVR